ncbi:MAG: hypothetical protein HY235_20415, partial [Acidobacteria bacterium]|nr:hypothetical protein [Acidobacteriota bacterium]
MLVLSLISSCGRPSKRPFDRAAIPPLENLTSVEQLDWVGRAAPYVITSAVMGTAGSLPLPVESARDAGAHRATQVLHGRYTLEGSTLRIHASVRDVPANRTVRDVEAAGPVEDVVPLLEKVSAALTTQPVRSHGNRKAVEAFGRSLLTRDPAEKLAYAGQAVEADPRFGFAVLTAAQIHVSQGKPQAAREVLERGLPQQPEGWMRARFREVLGSLEANAPAVFEAIRQELRFSPNNTDRMRQLADALLSRRQYAEAASWYQKAAALEPDQTQLWNLLSYTHAYARNFEAASASLASYRKSASADPNAYDTSGEILLMAGRFAEAEKYFLEAQRRDPQFLGGLEFSKAAFARFLSGDAAAADLIFGRYLESRRAAQDPLADLRHAHWLYLTGRREQAMERMTEAAGRQGDAASRANAFLGLWLVE